MLNLLKALVLMCAFSALCQTARGDTYDVTFDTAPLVGHPAGPFHVYAEFVDGSGIGDANNTVTMSNTNFGGGSALGSPFIFGGAGGSLESGVSITDISFVNIFAEQFVPGTKLTFALTLTSNDDSGGTPDGLTIFLLDNSGVPLPTLAPGGDYFLTVALGSGGPAFSVYGSDPTRAPSAGDPISMSAPTVGQVPEPSTTCLLGGVLAMAMILRNRVRHLMAR